jgi:hypothetical protein
VHGNLDGLHPLRISYLFLIEHVIVEYCVMLAKMGAALTKEEVVMQLTNDLIRDTVHAKKLKSYKLSRKLAYDEDNLVGKGWCRGFLKRNSDLIRTHVAKSRIVNNTPGVWCNYNNFFQLHDDIYAWMVEAGVAIKLDEELMLDKEGNIVDD